MGSEITSVISWLLPSPLSVTERKQGIQREALLPKVIAVQVTSLKVAPATPSFLHPWGILEGGATILRLNTTDFCLCLWQESSVKACSQLADCVHRKERLWWLHSIMGNTSAKVLGYQGTVTIVCWAPAVLGCIKKKIFWSLPVAREFILQLNKQETTRKLINLRSPQSKPPQLAPHPVVVQRTLG